ncbi:ABC transporter permease [bacterium 1XD42-94]|nr:ABC transporter permease [bacterium 1XD42-76]NBK04146.1 ABC transporter permease [bacterium 1XD42-94]
MSFADTMRKNIIKYFEAIRVAFAVLLAIGMIMIVIFFVSDQPMDVLYWLVIGPVTTLRRFGTIIELLIPLAFCGLGMCMMFQVNRFNLSCDGAFFIAGSATAILALYLDLPPVIFPALIIAVSALVGGCVTVIPAYINEKYKAHIVVSSIMLNYVLLYLGRFLLIHWLKDPTFSYNGTPFFPEHALLTRIVKGTRIHTGIFILVLAVILTWLLVYKTKIGYNMRYSGQNAEFARYVGIDTKKYILSAQFIGGMLAGMGGAIECMGIYQQLNWEVHLGYGFDGMLIAIIAKNNPAVVPIVAFIISYLRAGGDLVNRMTDVPTEFVSVIQSLVVIFIAARALLAPVRHRLLIRDSMAEKGAN